MTNSLILKLWVREKIGQLEQQFNVASSEEEINQIQGKLDILKEFYEDFNLEDVKVQDLIFHNNF